MFNRAKTAFAGGIVASVLFAGTAVAASPAPVVQSNSTAAALAVPCGYSTTSDALDWTGTVHTVTFAIKNCNSPTVKRKLDLSNGPNGTTCYTIPGNGTVFHSVVLPFTQGVTGLLAC